MNKIGEVVSNITGSIFDLREFNRGMEKII
jgi:hypothetical protein